jgi:hypothetical protein
MGHKLLFGQGDRYQGTQHVVIQLEVGLQFTVEGLVCGKPGQVIVTLEKLVLAFLDRIGETACAPALLMDYVCFAVGYVSLDSLPSLTGFNRAYHGAEHNHKFVMTQWFPYCLKFCRKAN